MDKYSFTQLPQIRACTSYRNTQRQVLFAVKVDETPLSPGFILREYPQLSPYTDEVSDEYGEIHIPGLKLAGVGDLLLFVEATSGVEIH